MAHLTGPDSSDWEAEAVSESDTVTFANFPIEFAHPEADSDSDSQGSLSLGVDHEWSLGLNLEPASPSPPALDDSLSDFFGERNEEDAPPSDVRAPVGFGLAPNVFDDLEVEDLPNILSSDSESSDSDDDQDRLPRRGSAMVADPPWLEEYGLDQRPHWWHYFDERGQLAVPVVIDGDAPALPHEEQAAEAAQEAAEQAPPDPEIPGVQIENQDGPDEPLQPDFPDISADSPTWAEYWTRKQLYNAWSAEAGPAPGDDALPQEEEASPDQADYPQQDFFAPGIVDGDWNRSAHVSNIAAHGFSISPDITKRGKKPPPMRFKNAAEEDYIDQLISDGILEEGETQFCVPHFFIYKPGKLRLVFNGKRLNAACKTPPKFNMKSHGTLQRLSARHSWHAADDLKNHFFSTKIHEDSRKFFGIHTPRGTFRYTSLPFGFSWSPFIAHVCVDEVCKRAIEAGFHVSHYLDDFHYFADSLEECERARDFVRDLLGQAGYRLNMKKEQLPGQVFTALGLLYDLNKKTVQAKPGFLSGLRGQHLVRSRNNARVSRKEIASVLGSFIFLNSAYPGILSHLNPLIAWVKAGGADWRLTYAYKRVAPVVEKTLKLLESLPPFKLQVHTADTPPTHLYTDASSRGLGLVFPNFTAAFGVPVKKTIYRLEADAVSWALQQHLPPSSVLRIDNEALVHALKKGRSNISEANEACARLFQTRLRGLICSAKWISTHINPADSPSRLSLARSELFVSPVVCRS